MHDMTVIFLTTLRYIPVSAQAINGRYRSKQTCLRERASAKPYRKFVTIINDMINPSRRMTSYSTDEDLNLYRIFLNFMYVATSLQMDKRYKKNVYDQLVLYTIRRF